MTALLRKVVCASTLLLLIHQSTELSLIHFDSAFRCHLKGQVDRESVRVVKCEGVLAAEFCGVTLGRLSSNLLNCEVKDVGSRIQRAAERGFLPVCNRRNRVPVFQ